MIYIIFISLIVLMLITKIEFRIINKEHKTVMILRVAKIIDINVDYFKYLKKFVTNKYDDDKFSIKELYENSIKLKENFPIISKYLETSILKEMIIINRFNDENPYLSVANHTLNAFISNYVHNTFGKVIKESYVVTNEDEIDFDFTCIIHTRLVNIIIVSIENIKEVVRLVKDIK